MLRSPESYLDLYEQQTDTLLAAIAVADSVTVEFGTGQEPLPYTQTAVTFDEHTLYIGVNRESKQHKYLADRIEDFQGFAVLSENGELPIPNGAVDRVYMANVFGEPDSSNVMRTFWGPDEKYHGHSSIDEKVQTLHKAHRLLRPGGEIAILETYTPYRDLKIGREPYAAVAAHLQQAGFRVGTATDWRSPDWDEHVEPLSGSFQYGSWNSYLVKAHKPA
jgi:hypothetical protein